MQKSETSESYVPWPDAPVKSSNTLLEILVWLIVAILVIAILAFMYFVLRLPVDLYLIRFWHIITWNFDR